MKDALVEPKIQYIFPLKATGARTLIRPTMLTSREWHSLYDLFFSLLYSRDATEMSRFEITAAFYR